MCAHAERARAPCAAAAPTTALTTLRRARVRAQLAQQLALLQTATSYLQEDLEPEDEGAPPPLPAAYTLDTAREDAIRRRLGRSGVSALVIAKAAVVLRRRASMARARVPSQRLELDCHSLPPDDHSVCSSLASPYPDGDSN